MPALAIGNCYIFILRSLMCPTLQVGLIATPDVHSFEVTRKDHFIILGCDGLWGVRPFSLLPFIANRSCGLLQ